MLRAAVSRIRHLLRTAPRKELPEVRAELAEVRAELAEWRHMFRAAGTPEPEHDPHVPAALLLAASRPPRVPQAVAVPLPSGRTVTAVIGGPGDPLQWWAALQRIGDAALPAATAVRRVPLPPGLHAAAVIAAAGPVTVVTSLNLPGRDSHAAARTALRCRYAPPRSACVPA